MTRTDDLLLDLVDLVYAAAVDREGWPRLLDRFCDLVPGAQAALIFHDTRTLACDYNIVGRWPEEFVNNFVDYYAGINPWAKALPRIGVGRTYTPEELVPRSELIKSEFFADWLRPQGVITGPSVVIVGEAERMMVLTIVHPDHDGGGADPAHLRLVQLLVPHLRRAASVHRHVADASLARATSQSALDGVAVGVAVVTAEGRPREYNRALEAMLRASDGLCLTQGRLTASEHGDARALQAAFRVAATASPDPSRRPGMVAVTRRSGRRPYAAMVSPFRPLGGATAEPLALVLVNDPEADQADGLAWLARLWRLTPAESRVFKALVSGQRLADLADSLGVSQNTLKSQMKAILQKSDCLGQSELIRVALRSTDGFQAGA